MRQPAIFIGHGSPMNAVEDNTFTNQWKKLGKRFTPKAILVISAHWVTDGAKIQQSKDLKKINDMSGFPGALYDLKYPAKGSIDLSQKILNQIKSVTVDNTWGIDHGVWSILAHMYPKANIPIVQLSLDKNLSPQAHYELGKQLCFLRDEGIMIIGSGNVVHSFKYMNSYNDFALEFDELIRLSITNRDYTTCVNYTDLEHAKKAVPSSEHYDPLLYILGASDNSSVEVFNNQIVFGSFSMTSYLFN